MLGIAVNTWVRLVLLFDWKYVTFVWLKYIFVKHDLATDTAPLR